MQLTIQTQLQALRHWFQPWERVVVAYSGGVDSALVAKIAQDVLGKRALAVTAVSPSLLPEDLAAAQEQAQYIGITHELIATHELANPNYAANPVNRCYFCKSELHDTLKFLVQNYDSAQIVDGVNADDEGDYRPGIQAARERGVRSPLSELNVNKLAVRELSRYLQLPWWDKPAQPCLSSRFPAGEAIDAQKLYRVGRAEQYLRQLGWRVVRVRSVGETARIEIPAEQIAPFVQATDMPALVDHFQGLGFRWVSLDLEGFRSGKLNPVLSPNVTH
ncbi:ATP-utilizing enzymes of the PP-loop superfamily [Gloeomargarita lithophora Alchichica-D10]|uniref:ATP-utilizing enzymes of the PP-loop superfamily n=1 Tax=Gloeomargarita lithophora Alchichica-D10 TaxID=1188229 RepID=A0A1J0A8S7_9CYAN|nr:ATP-dependent sacrificial sulfur transferase LarE [Gloeomargarita lithophora]APB32344.1 ATP-utilizing enzymes of the PP-loop superfamily [Gloeomargarita lithophora Alchichica-D10]